MDNKFSKLENLTEIKLDLIDLETAETQLKSMKIGYIKHSFVLKDMESEFNRLHDLNLKDYDDEIKNMAEGHALKQLENPDYYNGAVMKTVDKKTAQCFQAVLMLKNKKDEIDGRRGEIEIVEKNIKWIVELIKDLSKADEKTTVIAK